ncbi:YraN family protein [uncultured Demequina sp.]|uniref:YraN family protein n=1 Tax=uncultured Demequina sp. TaxID=693499 RepID=UPI0025EA31CB|nr:YraN family protein [uncultured Demequina sp.]
MDARQAVGAHGEQVVARALEEQGWEVLARNWRCARGEVDIIAADGDTAVAVEVKTRRSGVCGSGLEAVTPTKVARLRVLVGQWLATQRRTFAAVRVDAVAVVLPPSGPAELDHVRGIE